MVQPMSTAFNYGDGGWIANRPMTTGSAPSMTNFIRWAAAVGCILTAGTGGQQILEYLKEGSGPLVHWTKRNEITEAIKLRTPGEDIQKIREVMGPAISDLAGVFGVSRQSIYNWISGEQVADGNARKLADLARACDLLESSGLSNTRVLLKRKFANGRTLLGVVEHGGSASEAAVLLLRILKSEESQRLRMHKLFAARPRSMATADFDLPASNDVA